jgi:hypothetical protein
MTDQLKPEPEIDSDGIGRCVVACPRYDDCEPSNAILTCGVGICEPWVRQKLAELAVAAADHKAMEAIEQAGHDYGLERLREGDEQVWTVYVPIGLISRSFSAATPAEAILKAAEADGERR